MSEQALCAESAFGATLCGSQNFFDDRKTLQFSARKYLSHVVGNILLGTVEKRRNSFLAGPERFVHWVNYRFHLDQSVFGR